MKGDPEFYDRCARALRSGIPWFGARRARRAVGELAARAAEARAIELLLAAASHRDGVTRAAADQTLRQLNAAGVETLCALWVEARDAVLGRLIEDCGYVATQPLEVRVLSHFQAGKPLNPTTAQEVAVALKALSEKDAKLRKGAEAALCVLAAPAAVDAFCLAAARDPGSAAGRLAVAQGYRPSDPEESAVFLIATGQVDAFFSEHAGLSELRAGFVRAEPAVQAQATATASRGDARLAPFLAQPRPQLRACTREELDRSVENPIRGRDWPHLFHHCQELPLKHALPGWKALVESGWSPEDPGDAAVLVKIAEAFEVNGAGSARGRTVELGPAFTPPGTSAVFERWLEAGRQPDLARLGEAELLERLGKAAPPEGVPLVAALAARQSASPAARQSVARSEHWLIRLAGLATGLVGGAGADAAQEANHWVREIGPGAALWSLWPQDTTLEMVTGSGGPREAAQARSGPRAILRALLGQRLEAGAWSKAVQEERVRITPATQPDGQSGPNARPRTNGGSGTARR